mgnify:CR=1 FL=1
MRIEERKSKKAKKGVTYRVKVDYVDEYGIKCTYSKSGFPSKAKAREHGLEMEYKLKNGLIKKESTKTLDECFQEVMKLEKDKLSRGSIITYWKIYNIHIKQSVLASMPISKINYNVLQKHFNDEAGSSTVKIQKVLLKKVFKHAIRCGIIANDPTAVIEIPKFESEKEEPYVLSYEEFKTIANDISARKDFIKYSYTIAMYCGYYLGLRITEILALEKTDFDFDNDIVYISKKLEISDLKKSEMYLTDQMKTKKSRTILPVPQELKSVLIEWFNYNPFDLVCPDQNGDVIVAGSLRSALKIAAKKNGIDFHPHCLRHTYITNLVKSGTDIKTASELARHSNVQITLDIYSHSNIESKKEAVKNAFDSPCPKNAPKPHLLN